MDFPTTIEFVAHVNTRANMEKALPPKGAESRVPPDVFKANGGRNMANRTFKDKMTIGTGAERIHLYYFGRGHTDGDAWGAPMRFRRSTQATGRPSRTASRTTSKSSTPS